MSKWSRHPRNQAVPYGGTAPAVSEINTIVDAVEMDKKLIGFDTSKPATTTVVEDKPTVKLYKLPQNAGIKLYNLRPQGFHKKAVVVFGHINGVYSNCWLEGNPKQPVKVHVMAEFRPWKDGYRYAK